MFARSYLFVPGTRPDRFEKALRSGADAVILDLEDAVSVAEKDEAREAISAWLSPEHPAYVRVNGASTEWFRDDLGAIARPGLSGVLLPKAEEPAQISEAASLLTDEATIVPILETGLGIWEARTLAAARRVERLAFGALDFALDVGIHGEGEELLYARSRLVLASRVAGIPPPLDGVTAALDDPDRLAADVDRARRLGFGGKLCIHPRQVGAVNRGFSPSEAEVSWARRVVEAAETAGTGALRVDGEMVDRPVLERARSVLESIEPPRR